MNVREFIRRSSYIQIRVDNSDTNKLAEWVELTGCGKRTSLFHFAFKKESEFTMFLLRWSPTGELRDLRRGASTNLLE
jgi:hypothetical protein